MSAVLPEAAIKVAEPELAATDAHVARGPGLFRRLNRHHSGLDLPMLRTDRSERAKQEWRVEQDGHYDEAAGPVREATIPEEEQSIVDKVVPDFLWTTYESCAKESLEALAKNKRRVVPGPLSKAMNAVSLVAPRGLLSPVMGWFYAKMA